MYIYIYIYELTNIFFYRISNWKCIAADCNVKENSYSVQRAIFYIEQADTFSRPRTLIAKILRKHIYWIWNFEYAQHSIELHMLY